MPATSGIRQPAVAGMFYPDDPDELAADVDKMLAAAGTDSAASPIRMLLAPHAGYTYSGAVAAHAFSTLRTMPAPPRRAFIIGPSHVEAFDFTSIFDGTAYRTPLGDVSVDTECARALAALHPSIRIAHAGHVLPHRGRGEHGIEVELPFLQRLFDDMRVVPIVMGSQDWDACVALGSAIAGVVDWRHDVVIASSDLSHFYTYEKALELDGAFCETLATLNANTLFERIAAGECEACGAGPVVAAILATEALRSRACQVMSCINSGDVSGDHSSVVGYASAVITGDAP
jgi:MEMO1 family protein